MREQIENDEKQNLQELVNAFHLMWDHFPEPVQLANKKFEVMAANPACVLIGRNVGMLCIKHGPPEAHKGCLAQKAINEHKAMYSRREKGEKESLVFWLPIDGYPDYYIHFGIRALIDYD